MANLTLRLNADTEERVESISDAHELSRSEAGRRLLRKGIEADSRDQKVANGLRQVAYNAWGVSVVVFVVGLFSARVLTVDAIIWALGLMAVGTCLAILSDVFEPEGV